MDLKPCPFCGGKAFITRAMGEYWVSCIECNASSEMSSDETEAVTSWDKRSDSGDAAIWDLYE